MFNCRPVDFPSVVLAIIGLSLANIGANTPTNTINAIRIKAILAGIFFLNFTLQCNNSDPRAYSLRFFAFYPS